MHPVPQSPQECKNILLSMLPEEDYQSLLPQLEFVSTPFDAVLFERDKPIDYVYFPCSGEHSILSFMEGGASIEIGTVGYEGFSTVDILLGSDVAMETTVCEIGGASLRMPASAFKQAINGDTPLRRLALRYLQAYLFQVSQSVACNRLHALDERFARWILMSHDRMDTDHFLLTQEYLANMLGVHRPSVSVVARTFQQAGLIKYSRGCITILDRNGLEETACECYHTVKNKFERLLGRSIG